MTKNFLLLAALGLALSAIGAQAQEYQSQSTVYGHCYKQTTYEDGSTETTTWHVNAATGELTNVETVRTHATPKPASTPPPIARNPSKAPRSATVQTPIAVAQPAAQPPVIVIEGPMTPEEIRRLVNGE